MAGGFNPSEDRVVERPALKLLEELGWETRNGYNEKQPDDFGRETTAEVVLPARLRPQLEALNPNASPEALKLAIEALTRSRSALLPVAANKEVYGLLKDGVKVEVRRDDGTLASEVIHLIDWTDPAQNDFLMVSQFWVTGEMYKRRCDLVGFVNGIPLVFIELKASHRRLKHAFDDNLRDYKNAIPQLFWYTNRVILSNGSESRIGSMTAGWEHYADWKKINSEGEAGVVSLDTMLRGVCEPGRLLDLIENFTLFKDGAGGTQKIVAKNHQYLGVNNTLERMREIEAHQGKLGVFWHTQGSGKSLSMVFFAQKVLRKLRGNWTFLVITDRTELDDQIYKNFANTGVLGRVKETFVRAQNAEDLKEKLKSDNRYIFTLIQKFRTNKGLTYPKLSDRSDIIVITDEAHRSQYDTLAMNMRTALPNAAFIAFTGTPLMAGEERTRDVFGDYVSVYNFKQSIEDGATVPLYYENRIPELEIINDTFNDDIERVLEDAELDEAQELKLEREFAREYHLITRNDRLEKIAEDVVDHFLGRGLRAKAMMVCIDKATAVKMYDMVQQHWKLRLEEYRRSLTQAIGEERERLQALIAYMEETDMAVVVSQAQNEVEDLRAKGVDIEPHRRRMIKEDLDTNFKKEENPLRLVFVCAMWITGFDVPSCSTIYLDKPMRNHTLMQTIARANRVYEGKTSGLIVDYIGIFRNLQKALAIYGTASGGGVGEGDSPVEAKAELAKMLQVTIAEAKTFCEARHIDLNELYKASAITDDFSFLKRESDAIEAILETEESKRQFMTLAGNVNRIFKAILPDPAANECAMDRAILNYLKEKILSLTPKADVSDVMQQIDEVLDESIAAGSYHIPQPLRVGEDRSGMVDLSKIDFEALQQQFQQGQKRTLLERLKASLQQRVNRMVQLNRTRMDYLERLQQMIEAYNAGRIDTDLFFEQLVAFTRELNDEDKRGLVLGLTEEELALFDILMKPAPNITKEERDQVKAVAKTLLKKLREDKLVLDWRKHQQTRASVRLCVEVELDRLPPAFEEQLYLEKCDRTYQHIYDAYFGEGRSIYGQAA